MPDLVDIRTLNVGVLRCRREVGGVREENVQATIKCTLERAISF
jgi:hypothetical protein